MKLEFNKDEIDLPTAIEMGCAIVEGFEKGMFENDDEELTDARNAETLDEED